MINNYLLLVKIKSTSILKSWGENLFPFLLSHFLFFKNQLNSHSWVKKIKCIYGSAIHEKQACAVMPVKSLLPSFLKKKKKKPKKQIVFTSLSGLIKTFHKTTLASMRAGSSIVGSISRLTGRFLAESRKTTSSADDSPSSAWPCTARMLVRTWQRTDTRPRFGSRVLRRRTPQQERQYLVQIVWRGHQWQPLQPQVKLPRRYVLQREPLENTEAEVATFQ